MAFRILKGTARRAFLRDVHRADALLQERRLDEGRAILLGLRDALARKGLQSAEVIWSLAVAADCGNDQVEALRLITEALALDPLSKGINNSLEIIAGRVKAALASKDWTVTEPSTPALYRLLVDVGEADEETHVAMARFYAAAGEADAALALLEATTTVFPGCREAWAEKAAVARRLGDVAAAERADLEVAALGGEAASVTVTWRGVA